MSTTHLPGISTTKSSNKRKKTAKKRRARKAQTNKFLTAINVGQTVRLTKDRIAFVRYKGKVKFGVGIWYGVELYDSIIKTRHNGTVYGKRYFNCPRNKGLFIKRDIIMEHIKPQNIKKVLKELEQKQIKQKKEERRKQKEKEKKLKEEQQKKNKQNAMKYVAHQKNTNSVLALYQKQVYGNNKLMLQLENQTNSNEDEKAIKKDFKRFQRLSFMAQNNAEIMKMVQSDGFKYNGDEYDKDEEDETDEDENADENEMDDNEQKRKESESEEDPHKGIDIDTEAWDSVKEKPILELLDDGNNEDETFGVRLFYPLKHYIKEYEYVFNKGLLVKEVDNVSKQGRGLILECGVQGDNGWYIERINDENIRKYSKDKMDEILEQLLPDIGYDISLKQE